MSSFEDKWYSLFQMLEQDLEERRNYVESIYMRDEQFDEWDVNRNFDRISAQNTDQNDVIINNNDDKNAVKKENNVEIDYNNERCNQLPEFEGMQQLLKEECPQMLSICHQILLERQEILNNESDETLMESETSFTGSKFEDKLIPVNDNKGKRGRKTLVSQGLTAEDIRKRRRQQNAKSQQKKRDKKKMSNISNEESSKTRIITGEKIFLIEDVLQSVIKDKPKDDKHYKNISFVISILKSLPQNNK